MPLSALKFHFLQITFFSTVITRSHHLLTHTPFFRHVISKKRSLHLFVKITFFCSVLLLLTPETLPYHLFRQTNYQKYLKSSLKEKKKIFFFFYNLFQIFPLPLRKKNHLLFPPFLSLEIEKPQGKTSHKKSFFFFI